MLRLPGAGMLHRMWRNWFRGAEPSLEVHVPISPAPALLNMARALTLSLRRNGGVYRNAPVILTVGADRVDPHYAEHLPWLKPLGIEWRWLPESDFAVDTFWTNAAARYVQPMRSQMALMLDADVLIAAPFDDMVRAAYRESALAALIAFSSPFEENESTEGWAELFSTFDLPAPEMPFTHTGFGALNFDPRFSRCPAYFNQGVVCLPTTIAAQLGSVLPGIMADIKSHNGSAFRLQLALSVAIAKLKIPTRPLPMRYNFTNHLPLEARYPDEVRHARLLHLHGHVPIPKMELFASTQSMREFTARADLSGVNAAARQVIADVLPQMT